MFELEFLNPTFKSGLNFTVRLGTKWKCRINPDDIVSVPKGLAQIRKIYVCKLADIPTEVYENEHDNQCSTFEGLIKVLKTAYFEELKDFNGEQLEETTVTCIGFWYYERQ